MHTPQISHLSTTHKLLLLHVGPDIIVGDDQMQKIDENLFCAGYQYKHGAAVGIGFDIVLGKLWGDEGSA